MWDSPPSLRETPLQTETRSLPRIFRALDLKVCCQVCCLTQLGNETAQSCRRFLRPRISYQFTHSSFTHMLGNAGSPSRDASLGDLVIFEPIFCYAQNQTEILTR